MENKNTCGAERKDCAFRTTIGGQALIEGIFMRGPKKQAIVVRNQEGGLEVREEELKLIKDKHPILGVPFIRGVFNFLGSLVNGVKALMWSAEFYPEEEEEEPSRFEKWLETRFGSEALMKWIIGVAVAAGIGFSILLFIILSILLYKTRFGLRLRACGENPQAADSLGINVYKMRYAGTTISGALAGMGGFVYALTTANCSSNGDVAGFGFLALAVMIFGNWKPLNIAGASLMFGLFKCIAAAYTSLDINGDGVYLLAQIGISAHFYQMLPYLITIIVLAFTSKSSRAPKAEGIPYDKGSR